MNKSHIPKAATKKHPKADLFIAFEKYGKFQGHKASGGVFVATKNFAQYVLAEDEAKLPRKFKHEAWDFTDKSVI